MRDIEAGGNVVIFQGDKTSRPEKAVYDRNNRTVVLTGGHPQVEQCADTVKGEKITVYLTRTRPSSRAAEAGG